MKNKIYYSPEALNDLDEIWEYITEVLCNVTAANNVVDRILKKIDLLEEFSKVGSNLTSLVVIENDYRFLISGNYLIFYRAEEDGVYIDRIFYGRRNYIKILFNDYLNEEDV